MSSARGALQCAACLAPPGRLSAASALLGVMAGAALRVLSYRGKLLPLAAWGALLKQGRRGLPAGKVAPVFPSPGVPPQGVGSTFAVCAACANLRLG